MSKLFRDQKLTLTCPKCGHKTQQTVARLETSPDLPCPKCGVVTKYDARQFKAELAKADKAVDDLMKSFKKFGK
jgi:uncharacterized Zn finger protein